MIYFTIKLIVNIFYNLYYRIHFVGIKNIPTNKPIILAPNHVNAFIDPIIIAMAVKQKVRFFARGDVFKNPIAKWILNKLSISPVFRIQEGYAEVKKNNATFDETFMRLSASQTILIFPEAICVQERKLRPLKKGLARIVYQVEEKWNFEKEVLIIPIGLNYSSPHKFRSKVFVDVGKPISVKDYKDNYYTDKVKTINETTKLVEEKLSNQILKVDEKADESVVEFLEDIYSKELIELKKLGAINLQSFYEASKLISLSINKLRLTNIEKLSILIDDIKEYKSSLQKHKLRDHLLDQDAIERMNFFSFVKDVFIIYFGYPFYFIGMLFNYVPFYLSKKIADKKVKSAEFYASFLLNSWLLFSLFWYLLLFVVSFIVMKNLLFVFLFALFTIVLGLFVFYFYNTKQKIFGRWRLLKLVRTKKSEVEVVVELRNKIFLLMNEIMPKD